MKKRLILCVIVFVVLTVTVFSILQLFQGHPIKINAEVTENIRLDLGEIFYGQSISNSFIMKNVSGNTLLLKGVTECGCTKMTIDGSYVEAGDKIEAHLRYLSFLKKSTGHVRKKFLVNNILFSSSGKEQKKTILNGTLSVFVKPTIVVNPSKIEVLVPEGQEMKFSKIIEIENIGNYPITLKIDKNIGEDITVLISPENFTVTPQEKCCIEFKFTSPIEYRSLAYVSNIEFSGYLLLNDNSRIPLKYVYPVKIIPTKLAGASPGSLFFSNTEFDKTKFIRITPFGDRRFATESIVAPDSINVKELENCKFSVKLDKDKFKSGTFNKKVLFKGTVNGKDVIVEVPVMGLKK